MSVSHEHFESSAASVGRSFLTKLVRECPVVSQAPSSNSIHEVRLSRVVNHAGKDVCIMTKGSNGGGNKGSNGGGNKGSNGGGNKGGNPFEKEGGNWPSKTGNKSGDGRGNNPPK